MILAKPSRPKDSLQEIIKTWKAQIICLSPKGEGYNAYLINTKSGSLINYIHATCDELRHSATNYDSLLVKIKDKYDGNLKEAILNTIKYETTRRSFKKQHEWIQNSYKGLIEQKQLNLEQQSAEIKQLKQIIGEQKAEVDKIKNECRGQLAAIKAQGLLKQKEAEINRKNQEIARLNQQLEESDREIGNLKSELVNGMSELKLKYKWLLNQFIQEHAEKQRIDNNSKSLQSCQNIFRMAQKKISLLQTENKFLRQENIDLYNQAKMLRVRQV